MKNVRVSHLALPAAVLWAVALGTSSTSSAQDVCTGDPSTCERDYSLDVATVAVQPSLPVFKFQSRISQAKLPVGDVTFSPIKVRILKEGYTLNCNEEIYDVLVRDSVLNLEIGHGMTCDLPAVMAKHDSLSFQICIESDENCLKPVTMAHVPYAVKSEIAVRSNRAATADMAAQCHYAHRATADANLTTGSGFGHGYFDFHTPASGTASLASWGVPSVTPGGFLAWTPTDSATASSNTMTLCGIAGEGGEVRPLETLNLVSRVVNVTQGTLVAHQGAVLRGSVSVEEGALHISSPTTFDTRVDINGSASIVGGLAVEGETSINTDGAHFGMQVADDGTVHFWGAPVFHKPVSMTFDDGVVDSASVLDESLTAADLAPDSVTASEIAANAVGSEEVADRSLTNVDIARDTITHFELAPDSVTGSEIRAGAVTSRQIADESVYAEDLADECVHAGHIAASAVTSDAIKDYQIQDRDLAYGAVTSRAISNETITGYDVADRGLSVKDINWIRHVGTTPFATTKYTTGGTWHLCVLHAAQGNCYVQAPDTLPGHWVLQVASGSCGMMCFN